MTVVATAGHVDHGKSTLVHALTGTDPDRWQEEKDRGMTIDLGFAAATLPSGVETAFVDVPGHCRFVKNMLSGVGAVDACLFVVDATEGWKAQSEEHLRILELLGIRTGIIALTKVGLLDDETRELAALIVADRVRGTFLDGAELVPVDVLAGIGLDDLRTALDRLVAGIPAARDQGRPRMWIDRSFSIRGAGTVVTGTLRGGGLGVDDDLAIEAGDRRVRVRGLQSHYRTLRSADPGRRLAVNLAGVDAHDIRRGQALVRPRQWHVTARMDASLAVLDAASQPLTGRGAFAVYIGTGEFPARLRVVGAAGEICPGDTGAVRIWLSEGRRVPVMPGDRYILREMGRDQTLGGGEILDVDPVRPASRASPSVSVDRVIAERGWIEPEQLERLTGQRRPANAGRWIVSPAARAAVTARLRAACETAGAAGVDVASLADLDRAVLNAGVDGLAVADRRVFCESMRPAGLSARASAVLVQLERSPWSPPEIPREDRGALRELERAGLAVQAGELWFATSAVQAATVLLEGLLSDTPDGFTVAQAREVLGSSRKYTLPLLAHLDAAGVTRRRGDLRIAGPRLKAAGRG